MNKLTLLAIILTSIFCFCITSASGEDTRNWTGIVIHHSASGYDTTVEDIDRWHKERGGDGIGYHFVIGFNVWGSKIYTGRPLSQIGAHAKGRNETHIGICLIGFDKFTSEQKSLLKKLCKRLEKQYNIKTIERHHERCPGKGLNQLPKLKK